MKTKTGIVGEITTDKTDIFSTDANWIELRRPAVLTEADARDACLWLDMMKVKIMRSVDPTSTTNARPMKQKSVVPTNGDEDEQQTVSVMRPRTGP